MNRFAYAEANPWTFSDPSGHATCFSTSDLCDEQMAIQHRGTAAAKAASGRIGGRLNAYYSAVRRSHATARVYEGTPGTAFETDWSGEGTWGEDRSIAIASATGAAAQASAPPPMHCYRTCYGGRAGGGGDATVVLAAAGVVVIGGLVCVFGGCEAAAAAAAVYAGGEGILAAASAACMVMCQKLATIGNATVEAMGGSPNPESAAITTAQRAATLQGQLGAASKYVTMGAGIGTKVDGTVVLIVSSSEPGSYLRPGMTLNPGELIAAGNKHAEVNIINYAQTNGITVQAIGAGRPICASCAQALGNIQTATPLRGR